MKLKRVRLTEKPAAKSSPVKSAVSLTNPPKELVPFFADPPLIGDEQRDDYERLFAVIAAACKPGDAIAWLFTRDIADLSWEIRRERDFKRHAMNSKIRRVVKEALEKIFRKPLDQGEEAEEALRKWDRNPVERRKINLKLAALGYNETYIFAAAFAGCNANLDAFDARIATYEARRMAALRMVEQYSEKFARRLEAASSAIIEGEFSEAAE